MSNLSTTNCPQDAAIIGADREGNWGIIIDIVRACTVHTSLFVGISNIVMVLCPYVKDFGTGRLMPVPK